MIRTLLRKELVEHGLVFCLVLLVSLFGFLLVLAGTSLQESGSPLDSVHFYGVTFHLLVALVLCNRLVVQEYSGKTQLFLEGLPISRSAMLWTKYLLGLFIAILSLTGCFILALAVASRKEMIDLRFIQIMGSRLYTFAFLSYAFFFMMGLLGRYRIPIYAGLFFSTIILQDMTDLDLTRQGPFALLNDQFAFERVEYPVANLVGCLIAGIVFTVIAMLMGLVREGSVASLMAEKMTHREKLFATVAVASLVFVGSTLDEKRRPDPYSIPDAYTVAADGVSVHIESPQKEKRVTDFANQVHRDLASVREYFAIEEMPDLFLVNRRDLDADRYEPGSLQNASGTLIRANYQSDEFRYEKMRPYLIDVCLSRVSAFNAIYEPQCWVLEGFSDYWPRRETYGEQWDANSRVDLRAAYAGSLGVAVSDVHDWYQFRDRVDETIARAVGCSGLVYAERTYGKEKLRTFLQQVLRTDQPSDVRADWNQFRDPIAVVWKRTMGCDYEDFLRSWIKELNQLAEQFAEELVSVPRLTAKATMIKKSSVTYELQITPQCEPAPDDGNATINYEEISVYDRWMINDEAESQVEIFQPGKSISLKDTFAAGSRVRWTVRVSADTLDCDVISGWIRQEVR
jgi:hypothetical protein